METCRFPKEERPFFYRHIWLAGLILLAGLALFGASSYSLATHSLLLPNDQAVSAQLAPVRQFMPGWLETALVWLANLGSIVPTIVALYLGYRMLRKKCDDRFTLILASYMVGLLLFWFFALMFNRERPDLPGLLKQMPFPSYPSGHMIQTITLLAPILYLYLPEIRSRTTRVVLVLLAVLYTLIIGLDRLVTNAHYLTDVLGGIGLGLFWTVAVLLAFELYHLRTRRTSRGRERAYSD